MSTLPNCDWVTSVAPRAAIIDPESLSSTLPFGLYQFLAFVGTQSHTSVVLVLVADIELEFVVLAEFQYAFGVDVNCGVASISAILDFCEIRHLIERSEHCIAIGIMGGAVNIASTSRKDVTVGWNGAATSWHQTSS